MKIIRYDRGDKYYGRYDETGQHPSPFAKLVQKCAFVCNSQFPVHHNKMVYQKGVIEL